MNKLILGMISATLLAACSSTAPKAPSAPAASSSTSAGGDVGASATAAQIKAAEDAAKLQAAADAQKDAQHSVDAAATQSDAARLANRTVYFPTNVDTLQDADKDVVMAHGTTLGKLPQAKVRVDGYADERGSSEFNLALGQRRAKSTKQALILSGAKDAQISTSSYGEEKPVATGHDEAAWAQNRRAEINYVVGQ
ncbi:MAG: OmpA family protein [Sideroxydans sp.]|nr:OmpA family protein [Sideroxydans sp.]